MAHAFSQTLKLCLVKVILQDWSVIRMCALLDDLSGSFTWRHTPNVRQALRFLRVSTKLVERRAPLARYRLTISVTMTSRSCSVWSMCVHIGTMQLTPVGSVLEGRVLGVCMMEYLAERRKSAEPPSPLSMREPSTQVLLA